MSLAHVEGEVQSGHRYSMQLQQRVHEREDIASSLIRYEFFRFISGIAQFDYARADDKTRQYTLKPNTWKFPNPACLFCREANGLKALVAEQDAYLHVLGPRAKLATDTELAAKVRSVS